MYDGHMYMSAATTPPSVSRCIATQDLESCRDAASESPAGSPLLFCDERATLPVKLTTGRLQRDEKMGWANAPSATRRDKWTALGGPLSEESGTEPPRELLNAGLLEEISALEKSLPQL